MSNQNSQQQDIKQAKDIFGQVYNAFKQNMQPQEPTSDEQTMSFIESYIQQRTPMKLEHARFYLLAYPYGLGDATAANKHFKKLDEEPDVTSTHNVALRRLVLKLVVYNDPNEEKINALKLDTARPTVRIVATRLLHAMYNLYGSDYITNHRPTIEKMFLLSARLAQQPYNPAIWMDHDLEGMHNLFLLIWDIGQFCFVCKQVHPLFGADCLSEAQQLPQALRARWTAANGKSCKICGKKLPTSNTDKDMEEHCMKNHSFLMDILAGACKLASTLHLNKPDWIKLVKFTKQQFVDMQAGLITCFFKPPMQAFRADSFLARDLGTAQTRISGFFILSLKSCTNGKKHLLIEQKVLASTGCFDMLQRLSTIKNETEQQQIAAQGAFFADLNGFRANLKGSLLVIAEGKVKDLGDKLVQKETRIQELSGEIIVVQDKLEVETERRTELQATSGTTQTHLSSALQTIETSEEGKQESARFLHGINFVGQIRQWKYDNPGQQIPTALVLSMVPKTIQDLYEKEQHDERIIREQISTLTMKSICADQAAAKVIDGHKEMAMAELERMRAHSVLNMHIQPQISRQLALPQSAPEQRQAPEQDQQENQQVQNQSQQVQNQSQQVPAQNQNLQQPVPNSMVAIPQNQTLQVPDVIRQFLMNQFKPADNVQQLMDLTNNLNMMQQLNQQYIGQPQQNHQVQSQWLQHSNAMNNAMGQQTPGQPQTNMLRLAQKQQVVQQQHFGQQSLPSQQQQIAHSTALLNQTQQQQPVETHQLVPQPVSLAQGQQMMITTEPVLNENQQQQAFATEISGDPSSQNSNTDLHKMLETEANEERVSESASQPNEVVLELTTPKLKHKRDHKLSTKQNSSQKLSTKQNSSQKASNATKQNSSQKPKAPKKHNTRKATGESDAVSPRGRHGSGRGGGAGGSGRGSGGGAGGAGGLSLSL